MEHKRPEHKLTAIIKVRVTPKVKQQWDRNQTSADIRPFFEIPELFELNDLLQKHGLDGDDTIKELCRTFLTQFRAKTKKNGDPPKKISFELVLEK